ncbi:MAG: hypothetical protein KAG97_00865, partial [Victivallales bacterium]|nr:hypothetical protein [Victivallales bacterium]
MKIVRFTVFPALALVFVLFVSGCGKRKGKPVSVKEKSGMRTWERIKASGTLRVLKLVSPRGGIPRTVADSDLRESALEGFAAKHHLRLTIIYSERPEKIISTLKNGAGDIAANGISITPYLASTLCETLRLPTAGDSGSKRAVG